jgi:D-tyrosyl-tRNA(Tyr) deacylase
MRAVIQRVTRASVTVGVKSGVPEVVGSIGPGLLILLGVGQGDSEVEADWLANKIVNLRIFPDERDKLDRSLLDIGGEALVVSQFTLYGDCRKGRRPAFTDAAHPSVAEPLYERFCSLIHHAGVGTVAHGRFGADMAVALENDGPLTLILESPPRTQSRSTEEP